MSLFIYIVFAILILRIIGTIMVMNPILGIALLGAGFFYLRSRRDRFINATRNSYFNQQGAFYNANKESEEDEYDSSYNYDDSFRQSYNYDQTYDSSYSSNTSNSKDVFEAEYTEKDAH